MTAKQFKAIQRKAKAGQATRNDFEQIESIMDKIALSKLNSTALAKQHKAGQATKQQVAEAFNIYLTYANKQYEDAMEGRRKALEALNNK